MLTPPFYVAMTIIIPSDGNSVNRLCTFADQARLKSLDGRFVVAGAIFYFLCGQDAADHWAWNFLKTLLNVLGR